jgi:hypothetical protein
MFLYCLDEDEELQRDGLLHVIRWPCHQSVGDFLTYRYRSRTLGIERFWGCRLQDLLPTPDWFRTWALPISASLVLGFQACITTPSKLIDFYCVMWCLLWTYWAWKCGQVWGGVETWLNCPGKYKHSEFSWAPDTWGLYSFLNSSEFSRISDVEWWEQATVAEEHHRSQCSGSFFKFLLLLWSPNLRMSITQ